MDADRPSERALSVLLLFRRPGRAAACHVERDDCEAKFWLDPVRLERSRGFARKEIVNLLAFVEANQKQLLRGWDDYFNG